MSKLSPAIEQAINDQIRNELSSSYIYLSMSAFLDHEQFTGFAAWMRMQSQEENTHAMRLYDFLLSRGGRVKLQSLPEPRADFGSPAEVFEQAYVQEQTVTQQIESLYELAFHEKAFAALVELEWFIKEQVEEEKTLRAILKKFKLIGDDQPSLIDLDRELGSRQPEAAGESAE